MTRVKTVEITETYKMPDMVSKVMKGVELLDQKVPGWDKKVDLDALNLGDGMSCVVGQLAIKSMLNGPLDGYRSGIKKLIPGLKDTLQADPREDAHGFVVSDETAETVSEWLKKQPVTHPWWPFVNGPEGNLDYTTVEAVRNLLYDYLTAIWISVIKSRRSQARKVTEARRAAKKATAAVKKVAKKAPAKKATAR